MDHIETFNPTISHYRREHAPNVRYLPSDVTITFIYQHFIKKFPESDRNYILYEYYRCKVKEKNISFAQLGHEQRNVNFEKVLIFMNTKVKFYPNVMYVQFIQLIETKLKKLEIYIKNQQTKNFMKKIFFFC